MVLVPCKFEFTASIAKPGGEKNPANIRHLQGICKHHFGVRVRRNIYAVVISLCFLNVLFSWVFRPDL